MNRTYEGYFSELNTDVHGAIVTPREAQLFQLLSFGYDLQHAAEHMHISLATVKRLSENCRGRLAAKTTAHAIAILFRSNQIK